MGKTDKLLKKARNNPAGLSFKEFETLMARSGWIKDHQRGSHIIWYSVTGYRISVQSRQAQAKGYQVKQFLKQYDEEQTNGR